MISFHVEATDDPAGVLRLIRSTGAEAGLAFNPDFPVDMLRPYLEECDFVVMMSVFAGFGGQKFIESTWERLPALKSEIMSRGLSCRIEVDGGVSPANARALAEAGADILVAGSAVFKSEDPAGTIRMTRNLYPYAGIFPYTADNALESPAGTAVCETMKFILPVQS